MLRHALVLASAVALSAAPIAAQSSTGPTSTTKGWFVGFQLGSASTESEELFFTDESYAGGGAGVHFGYGFTPRFALAFDLTGSSLDVEGEDVAMGHFDILGRYAFTGPTRRWVPFLEAGFSGRAIGQENAEFETGETGDLTVSGAGFTYGGGLQYYMNPRWAIGAGIKFTNGEYSQIKVDNVTVDGFEIDGTSTRFNIGITWYAKGGR